MSGFSYMVNGLTECLYPINLLIALGGTAVGIVIGALPGLSATMAIAIMVPVTFTMDAIPSLILLGATYCGAIYGGSISACLLNTPGTPASAATCLEGYAMTQRGMGGKALGMSAVASFIGGIFSTIALLLIAPPLAKLALSFGAPEFFLLAVMGLSIIISLSVKSFAKGFLAGFIGLLLATVGMDPMTGYLRFTFGTPHLMSGLPLVPTLIGLLSTSQLFLLAEKSSERILKVDAIVDRILPTFKEMKDAIWIFLRSSILGTVIGVIPGAGANIATFIAYDDAKRISKHKEDFGKGAIDGVAATESCNNAVIGGAMVPMLTLGIPGSNTTAVLLGGLMLHGLRPGPDFFAANTDIAYSFIMSLFVANIIMLVLGICCAKYFAHIVKCPNEYLIAIIMLFSVVGSFSISNSVFDVFVMFFAGIVGYVLKKADISPVPLVLAFILGGLAEQNFRRSIMLAGGESLLTYFMSRPVCLILLVCIALSLMVPCKQMFAKIKFKNQ